MLSDDDSDYAETKKPRTRKSKRRKVAKVHDQHEAFDPPPPFAFPLDALAEVLRDQYAEEEKDDSFETIIQPSLESLIQARRQHEDNLTELDESGQKIRPLRTHELVALSSEPGAESPASSHQNILHRKAKVELTSNRLKLTPRTLKASDTPLTPLPRTTSSSVNADVLDGLYNIQTTPYDHSFLSRIQRTKSHFPPGLIAVDWETRTPWMDLLSDIHDHYSFAHPERDQPRNEPAPITYSTLHASHLSQVHDLLERSFWGGINVSDCLDYQPERSTVVAKYKKIVVGIAVIASPRETYIMYLAVKAGWDKSQIARTMLYHLITMNPLKDITLHVSTNNSAMLLYNQFGFKAEGFVAGFYARYTDPQSRLSHNAFKLRLRHLPD